MKEKCIETLNTYKITPTVQRIELLALMVGIGRPFSIEDLKNQVSTTSIAISDSTIATTLILFESRKLLKGAPEVRPEKVRGRPMTLYTLQSNAMP